jgi:predicted Zn-dependent peptidase
MIFMIVPAPGHSIEENQRAFEDMLLRFKSTLVDQAALDRAKAQVRATFMRRVAANDDVAGLLAEYHAQYGDWRKLLVSLDDLPKVTADTVQRAAGTYLVATGRTTAYTVAPGEADRQPAPRPQPAERKTGGLQ